MARIRPATYTLRIPQRATLEEPMTLKAGGVAMQLTGYTVLAQIWKDEKRRVKLADLMSPTSIEHWGRSSCRSPGRRPGQSQRADSGICW